LAGRTRARAPGWARTWHAADNTSITLKAPPSFL